MSQWVFPSTLPGLLISVSREADYAVEVQTSISRKETRFTRETYPITKYRVGFEVLRSDSSLANRIRELQQALTHIARHYGMLDSFLLIDPADSSVTDHGFAVGDGVTAAFQLQRTLAGDVIDAAGFEYQARTKPYTNLVKNSSFEASSAGLATSWIAYNNSAALEPINTTIVPGMNGGVAQRVSWGTTNTTNKGVAQVGSPAWVAGQWYTISFFARAFGGNVGKFMGLNWNTAPNQTLMIANPALTGSWQRYVFQVFWNIGTSPPAEFYLTISGTAVTAWTLAATFGDLDFDETQVVAGQHGATEFQPIPGGTPAAATATRTPSYWPASADGFEPIFDLNGDSTIYEDGTWRGRRTLYPWTRTNLLPFSEQLNDASWAGANCTVTANNTTAPDGTATADLLNEGTATGFHFLSHAVTEAQGELRCYSIFVKAGTLATGQWVMNVSGEGVNFDASAGTVPSNIGATLASGVQSDPRWPGWYRFWFVKRVSATLGTAVQLVMAASSYTGTSRTFFAWGAMCERVSNLNGPTPYIATPSSAAVTVTDYTLSSTGAFTPAAVPAAGTFYSMDASYYRRVRFADQSLSVEQLVQSLWAAKAINLISVKS